MRFQRVQRLAFVGILAVLLALPGMERQARAESVTIPNSFQRSETARLQAHFLRVEAELRNRDVSSLSQSERQARQRLLSLLAGYRVQGRFPRNQRYAHSGRVPIFRDDYGTLCAMAYLVDETGGRRVINCLARTRNTAYLPQVADDPALAAWLRSNGLFVDEAARIQPTYDYDAEARARGSITMGAVLLSTSSFFANGFSIAYNSRPDLDPKSRRKASGLCIVTGLFGIAVGADHISKKGTGEGNMLKLGVLDTAVGLASLIYGLRTRYPPKPENAVTSDVIAPVTNWSLAPLNGTRTGAVAFHTRF